MQVILNQKHIPNESVKQIVGFGRLNLKDMDIENETISICIPIEIENNFIKRYIEQAHRRFKQLYPKAMHSYYEAYLIWYLEDAETNCKILVSFIDDDIQVLENIEIQLTNYYKISSEIDSEIKKTILEQLAKIVFGK